MLFNDRGFPYLKRRTPYFNNLTNTQNKTIDSEAMKC